MSKQLDWLNMPKSQSVPVRSARGIILRFIFWIFKLDWKPFTVTVESLDGEEVRKEWIALW